jgi:hypothetical protein
MNNNENRSGKVRRQTADNVLEGFNGSRRTTDDDHVSGLHGDLFSATNGFAHLLGLEMFHTAMVVSGMFERDYAGASPFRPGPSSSDAAF